MKKKEYYSIGIMSGTSLDGIDISLIKTDGNKDIDIIKNEYNYQYLTKVLDSHDLGFTQFNVQVFEINYEKFHKLNL